MLTVFTIGHSTHEPGTFAELLAQHDVRTLVDVRRYPGSRRVSWTNAGEIERALPAVEYRHLPGLGGRRRPDRDSVNGFWENNAFRGYADHMASDEFATALESLLELARQRTVAVMCAEGPWWRCHRRLLADALVGGGFDVCHIDRRGRAEPHRLTEGAVVEGTRVRYPPAQEQLGL
ncbi:MAG TPA: DUF488 domain-containing protein [Thermoleophilaceae bacterium]|nr:DUF488 domain-containing protein [Thermoleophilaceae bacterium]